MRIRPRSRGEQVPLLAIALLTLACSGAGEPTRVERLALSEMIDVAVVELPEGAEPIGPASVASDAALFLPAGSTTSFAFFSPADAQLRVERLVTRGGAELSIDIETDAGAADPGQSDLDSGRDRRLELPTEQPVRIVFSVSGESTGAEAGVLLRQPAIWGAPEVASMPVEPAPATGAPPPVVIYLIDTLRRDRLGLYGYDRPISPEIDAFAEHATVFENGLGQSSWTKASVASIFTGVWPLAHGAISWSHRLSDQHDTLAEVLERAGYATGGFSTNPNIIPHFGFDQGFQEFFQARKMRSKPLNDRAFAWLGEIPPEQPFFLYAQPMDPHTGYNPPPEFLDKYAPGVDPFGWQDPKRKHKWPVEAVGQLNLLYDAEIAANDASFGELLRELERRGQYDEALIILTSDHGEEFQDHGGWRHGTHLYAETSDIPMIVKFPGQTEGRRLWGPAQHIDILPTVLDVVGLPFREDLEGRSLAGDGGSLAGRPVYSHLRLGDRPTHLTVVIGEWKLMQRRRQKGVDTLLYNRSTDPRELENLADRHPVRTAAMVALLEKRLARSSELAEAETVEIDAELEESLRALGYLD